jgi:hypothetical protein
VSTKCAAIGVDLGWALGIGTIEGIGTDQRKSKQLKYQIRNF